MANKLKKIPKILKKTFSSKIAKKIYLGLGLSVFSLALIFFIFNLVYNNRILPKTYIGESNFGGLNRAEAENLLAKLENESQNSSLNYHFENKPYALSLSDLKVDWKAKDSETLDNLLGVGRSGGIGKILSDQTRSIFKKNRVFSSFLYQNEKLENFIKTIALDIDKPEKDATIEIKDSKPNIIPEEIGRSFNFETNKKIALETIGSFDFRSETAFFIKRINPKVTEKGLQTAMPEIEAFLASKLTLKAQDKTFNLSEVDIAQMLDFDVLSDNKLSPKISSEKLRAYVDKIASEVNQEAKDAKFEISGGRVQTFQTSQSGFELDKEKSVTLINESFKKGEIAIELPVIVTEPEISSDASTEGINELIGEGKTSWRGSPANRIHNLTLGAQKISGTIVRPGEEFSTVKAIGEIGPATGFLQELVIKNSTRVEPEYGGGLCQVSTTLFRAVIHSGLKVTARTPHSFRVSYYEPPVGMDATIYDPAPDLKFINTYKTPILIWAVPGSNTLDFQIYGTKDARNIEISDPVTFDYTSAGEPIYTETATMAAGAIRQVERATPGCSASFTYKVTGADGTVLENETFVSKYVPIPNSFLYGPGTEGIPGVEGATTQGSAPTPTPSPTPAKKQ